MIIHGSDKKIQELDLIDIVPEELWTEVHKMLCTEDGDQNHPQEKEMQKVKMVV